MDSLKKFMDAIVKEQPSEEELNNFSVKISDLMGSQNLIRHAYFCSCNEALCEGNGRVIRSDAVAH